MGLKLLDAEAATRMRQLCETLVPGSGRAGPEIYIDALLAELPEDERADARGDLDAVAAAAEAGGLAELAGTPSFERARVMAVEAYYSDFVAYGADGPGAWERIGFRFPLTERISKDWSFMGIDMGAGDGARVTMSGVQVAGDGARVADDTKGGGS